MTTILAALVDASDHGGVQVIRTDSLTAVHILRTIKSQTNTSTHNKAARQINARAAAANQRLVDNNSSVETQWHKTLKLDATQGKHLIIMDRDTQKAI